MRVSIGTTDIPTAGTRVQISNTVDKVKKISVTARPANTGNIFFGTVTVSSTVGVVLRPGDAVSLDFEEGSVLFSTFYLDAATSGDDGDYMAILE